MNRRGFFVLEIIVGMVLMLAIAASLTVTLSLRNQVHQKAQARRHAADRAEAALVCLQNGSPQEDSSVVVEPLTASAPRGFQWARARCAIEGQDAQIVGLIPREVKP